MSAESRSLTAVVARIIELQRDMPRINPSAVASAALLELDPKRISVPAVLAGCHLALRQIARRLLRKRFEDADASDDEDDVEPEQSAHDDEAAEPEQPDLFPPGLQRRYPSSKQTGEYVLLPEMSSADIGFNVARLRKEGSSKTKHADALERFGLEKAASGAAEPVKPAA
jgi:hypothetical protein